MYSYGDARLTYEARWTNEAYEVLAEIYPQLPVHLRPLAKRLIMQQLDGSDAGPALGVITRSDVQGAWRIVSGRLGLRTRTNVSQDLQNA